MYFVEVTDTFAGEANYCWVKRFNVAANTERGAICKVSRETGYSFRNDGPGRYNARGACVVAFVEYISPEDIDEDLKTL